MHTLYDFQGVVQVIRASEHVRLDAVMVYEAHIAGTSPIPFLVVLLGLCFSSVLLCLPMFLSSRLGLPDSSPFGSSLANFAKRTLKKVFTADVQKKRAAIRTWLEKEGMSISEQCHKLVRC